MNRKLLFTILVSILTIGMAACGSTTAAPNETTDSPEASEEVQAVADTSASTSGLSYAIADTGQDNCYNADGEIIDCPAEGEPFYGQDAQYSGIEFSFTDNGDGTVTDNVTGLMWQQIPDDGDFTWEEAVEYAENLEYAGYDDWRLPTAKELFSLIDFEPEDGKPVLDTDYFEFPALSENAGGGPGDAGPQGGAPQDDSATDANAESEMPAPPPANDESAGGIQKEQGQFWSSNFYYVGTTHGDAETAFGVNHVTGHIKGYPAGDPESEQMGKRVRVVRGDEYGINEFVDNGDGTINDLATGLMWMQDDYGEAIEWEEALAYAENLEFAGYDDWKLPSVRELQSIVDYSGVYPAVDPDYFNSTMEENEDYWTWLWTSTSADESGGSVGAAWYVAFGKGVGLDGLDSHGAGAVRERQKYAESIYTEEGDTYVNSLRAVRVITSEQPAVSAETASTTTTLTYPIVDTNQGFCYDGIERIDCPAEGEAFYGQDAQYTGITPSYTDNGDSTINDNVTGLVWAQELSSYSMPWSEAAGYCESLDTGGVTDWRLPSVKELWSLRDYSQGWPWIDTDYFYLVGDGSDLRQHHSWSSDLYLVESEYQNEQVVGDPAWIVNDWTGHIKAMSGSRFVRCVSGDEYGINDFVDNGDGTVTDNATGLMWSQDDSGQAMYWEEALAYSENATVAGYDDWRLPSAKELQSLANYSATEIPVLDTGVFNLTEVTNTVYDGEEIIDTQLNYPFYWSNTSNPKESDSDDFDGGTIYAWAFSSGYNVDLVGYDLHGAGSLIFVSKTEENSGIEDSVPVMVRLVRDGNVTETPEGDPTTVNPDRVVVFEDGEVANPGGGTGGEGQQGDQQGQPDFAAAAEALGVTEEALMEAMGEPGQGPDFAAIAEVLGVTEADLMDALGVEEGGSQP